MGNTDSCVGESPPTEIKKSTEIRFYLHDTEHKVSTEDITPNTSLNYYLRHTLDMKGTKGMCYEGGCGSCVVVLQNTDPVTKKEVFLAVNSCLVPLLSCNEWRIFTIEGIGNPTEGYHPLQEVLAHFNGTQCGFCSPGMVMNMFALYESNKGKFTMEQVENSFSGNICRCTGYRSILSAYKSLATDASTEILGEVPDIEDFVLCYKEKCAKTCKKECRKEPFYLEFPQSKWLKVHTLRDILKTVSANPTKTYRLVAGNTAQGVYSSYKEKVDLYIDISDVSELKEQNISSDACVLGGNITLNDAIELLSEVSKNYPQFSYFKDLADHIELIANVPVRNRATLAGNLMIKHDHHEFPSDIFLIMETIGARITVVNIQGHETKVSPAEFVKLDMEFRVLKNITLIPYAKNVKFISYKIMPRAQNTHAHLNAGFLFKFDTNNLIQSATIVFGNVNSSFVHATQCENFLKGKSLFDNSVLKLAYTILGNEVNPAVIPPDPSPKFRKQLAISLFYKTVLKLAPSNKLSPKHKSGGDVLKRGISSGAQDYETNKSMYPVGEPIQKIEALAQTTGQAQYVFDLPDLPSQLYCALVLAKAPPNSKIKHIDPKEALASEGIVAFYSKNDIPGKNTFVSPNPPLITTDEELFCSGKVKYYEQPIGVLVGKSQKDVDQAVDLVSVSYQAPDVEPLLTVRQILKEGRTDRISEYKSVKASRKGNDVKHIVKGTFDIYQQYHFHMENHCCSVVPTEQGLDVYPSSQWMDMIQMGVAKMLNIQQNRVNIIVRRLGGSFGAKIARPGLPACAAALAAWKLKKPVKIWLPLKTNMVSIGKRFPLSTDYEVGVDDKGVIQYLNCSHYSDVGYKKNEDPATWIPNVFLDIYTSDTFTVKFNYALTDTHTNAYMRGPGSVQGIAAIESIVEHISYAINVDPLEVRLANLSEKSKVLAKYISDIKSWAKIDERKADIANFNKQNRWKKKGLSVVPMNFDINIVGPFLATVSIFHLDGSIQISHGGVEMGQGINTKAAQACAYKFGVPMDKIIVLPGFSFISPNCTSTGTTITSEAIVYAVAKACDELLSRLKPYRKDGAKWEDVVTEANKNMVQLVATREYSPNEPDLKKYSVYGVCAAEVIVDILTGQHIVSRVDLIEDTGNSLNPVVDIGQAEGGFVMGLGYNTTEKIVFNYEGKILTNNTWTYLPPGAKDIPVVFNVKFPKGNPNPVGVLKSKGTGEPPTCFGIALSFAIRNALASARTDASPSNTKWYPIDGTTDLENVFLNSLSDASQYVL